MQIRKATSKDLAAIVELLAHDKLGAIREQFQTPLPTAYIDAFARINRDEQQELMVMESTTGKVVGTLQLSFIQYLTYQGGIRAQIEAVRIHHEFRSQGLGAQLFHWAIARAKNRGAHVVQLTTDKQRPEALKFYQDLGFTASHEGMKMHL